MNATKLRITLAALLVVLATGCAAGGWWAQGYLAEKVKETDHARIDAEVSQLEIQKLKQLKEKLAKDKDIVERAKQISSTAAQYRYQDKVVQDIGEYANRRGIQINSFDFNLIQKSQSGQSAAPTGAEKVTFTITLRGPLPFDTFAAFLRDIESNLTKIQVTSLTIAPDIKDIKKVTNLSLTLEVYVKK
jgi:hypothetical protein